MDRFEDPFMDELTLMENTSKVSSYREHQNNPIADMTFSESPLETMKQSGVPFYRPKMWEEAKVSARGPTQKNQLI